jgi:hypothetical protein
MRFRFYVLRRRQGRLTRVLTKHFGSLMGYLGRVALMSIAAFSKPLI